MRIALLIGVASYRRQVSLPACKRDAEALDVLLEKTHQFEHRLCLTGELLSRETKNQALAFLNTLRGQSVSQALFYFSGHGTVQDGNLLYMLSDFDEEHPHQTSIENEEIDNWMRALAPDVAVKLTDCCHSGMPYVKDENSINSAVSKSRKQFSSCYFLSAPQANEVTYAGDNFSDFTEHIFKGLAQMDLGPVRYKDLIDTILDGYQDNRSQRPYIVQQGDMRDVFFEQTVDTHALLSELVGSGTAQVGSEEALDPDAIAEDLPVRRSLVELVEADAKDMLAREAVTAYLDELRGDLGRIQVDEELRALYELKVEFSKGWEVDIPNEEIIGKWLRRTKVDLFAEPIEDEIKTRVPYHLLDAIESVMHPFGKVDSKREITGVRITSGLEYDFVRVSLEPRYPNIDKYEAAFLLLWSRREVVLFKYFTPLHEVNWSKHELPEPVPWKVVRFSASGLRRIGETLADTLREMEKLAKDNTLQRFQGIKV